MWQQELEYAKQIASEAGSMLKNGIRCEVISNAGRDIKLQADINSEQFIIKKLKGKFDYPIIAEESDNTDNIQGNTPYWIVDPLDGTLNYSRELPLNCVSIALWKNNEPILGVIYDFNRNELFCGVVGSEALCNGKKIKISNITESNQAVLGTGFPVNRCFEDKSITHFLKQIQKFKKIRMFGTAALTLGYVACGRIDAYHEENIMIWDVAAGIAIVKAAGGFIYFKPSGENNLTMNVFCASSQRLDILSN